MNEQQAKDVVERLRRAAKGGALIEELTGDDARDFVFVADIERRPILLGSFLVEAVPGKPFYVTVVVKSNRTDDFQFFVMEKRKTSPILGTSTNAGDALVWRYTPTKQSGSNAARKQAFISAAGSNSIRFPLPDGDVRPFAEAIARAIELRRSADEEGGETGDLDETEEIDVLDDLKRWHPDSAELLVGAQALAKAIREVHELAPGRWSVTRRRAHGLIRLNVGMARIFDFARNHTLAAVDLNELGTGAQAAFGTKLDSTNHLSPDKFGPNAVVAGQPSEIADLFPQLLPAYRALVTKAAKTSPLHQRHHDPEVLEALRALTGEAVPDPLLSAIASTTSYWKISPGEQGENWERCREGNFIAVGWDSLGDLDGLSRKEFEERVAAAGVKAGVEQLWKFRNIAVGDRIVANAGTVRVLGIGTVSGAYYFVPGERHGHRLPVTWNDVAERTVSMKGWRQTLVRLTKATFDEITAAQQIRGEDEQESVDEAAPTGGIDFEGILSHLESKSLSFPAETVASYLLALQARRFVLLTGISGTGKTQLALEIARIFAPQVVEESGAADGDTFELIAQFDHIKRARFVVPAKLAKQFDVLYDEEQKRIDLKLPHRAAESMAIYKDADRPNLLIVQLSGEARTWFQSTFENGDRFLLRRQMLSEKETLVLELPGAAAPTVRDSTHELIAVRPDWTDARALLGFYNPLTKSYLSTPTLGLIRKAQLEVARAETEGARPRPFFLVFDEMNLARVEHYFSDFLSAMESGEEIHLHDDDEVEEADETPIPKRLRIPWNLFVVGTVNIDETTHMFSPKVLDRAFVLEFNHVDLILLNGHAPSEDSTSTPIALSEMGAGLKLLGKPDDAEWARFEAALGGELAKHLRKLHDALAMDNRHFGYRVAREIARFVDLASEQSDGTPEALRAAFDIAIFSKVLPKLHGGQAELQNTLDRLLAIAVGREGSPDGEHFFDSMRVDGTRLVFTDDSALLLMPRTALKLWRMRRRLRAQGFVSFIE